MWKFAGFVVTLVFAATVPIIFPHAIFRLTAWLVVAGGVMLFVEIFSEAMGHSVLIDRRNRYSGSHLVTLAWFVVIVSAYLSTSLWNVQTWHPTVGNDLPIAVDVPNAIWVLAGIVTVDLVGSGIVLAYKFNRAAQASGKVTALSGAPSSSPVFTRSSPSNAVVLDLVGYDEMGVHEKSDLGALQRILFQIAAVVIYVVALGRLMLLTAPADPITVFPQIPEGFLVLLGVSTVMMLANRAIPR